MNTRAFSSPALTRAACAAQSSLARGDFCGRMASRSSEAVGREATLCVDCARCSLLLREYHRVEREDATLARFILVQIASGLLFLRRFSRFRSPISLSASDTSGYFLVLVWLVQKKTSLHSTMVCNILQCSRASCSFSSCSAHSIFRLLTRRVLLFQSRSWRRLLICNSL